MQGSSKVPSCASSAFRLEDVAIASNGSTNGTTNVTTLHQFPSIVQVEFYNSWGWGAWEQTCAASILNELNVLTAASCFSGPNRAQSSRETPSSTKWAGDTEITLGVLVPPTFSELHALHLGTSSTLIFVLYTNTLVTNLALSSAFVTSFSVATNQTSNATSNLITAYPSFAARFNGDVGGPWIWGTITVGVIPANNQLMNGTAFSATTVSAYTNWILNAVSLWR
ncbi:uncharacterized protein LOC120633952 [Pararge aegeria]|uniref:uncharacterized protein LOC120633952 n=1 Tax=Pararge aegeria TaxID=116150 RepID=UPI0019D2EA96|nr:uncharacterized protein LOC120633952 [Pararge aegeria]